MKAWKASTLAAICAAAAIATLIWLWHQPQPKLADLQVAELLTKIIAFGAIAIFAIYKLLSGFHLSNMSLDLSAQRTLLSEEEDTLAISLAITKGERGTIIEPDPDGAKLRLA